MPNVGSLTADLIARTAKFEAGLKRGRKSIKGLSDQSKKTSATVTRLSKQIKGLAAAGLAAAGIGGLSAMISSSIQLASEITNLSRIANANFTVFQRNAAAAKTVGIEQQKLADIYKDTNDKIGDFVATGGGPLADFFEQIAPQVGVTADEFRRLSGPDALQLYVSSLEKANLSQQDMTFYLEAIASDSTALLPLLRNNGAEMKRLGKETVVFGEAAAMRLKQAKDSLDNFKRSATIKLGEIISGAADGAALKILSVQLLGAAAKFTVSIIEGLLKIQMLIPASLGVALFRAAQRFNLKLAIVVQKFTIRIRSAINTALEAFNKFSPIDIPLFDLGKTEDQISTLQKALAETPTALEGLTDTAAKIWNTSPFQAWKDSIDAGTQDITRGWQRDLTRANNKIAEEARAARETALTPSGTAGTNLESITADATQNTKANTAAATANAHTADQITKANAAFMESNKKANAEAAALVEKFGKSYDPAHVAATAQGLTAASGNYQEFIDNFRQTAAGATDATTGATANQTGPLAQMVVLLTEIRDEFTAAPA